MAEVLLTSRLFSEKKLQRFERLCAKQEKGQLVPKRVLKVAPVSAEGDWYARKEKFSDNKHGGLRVNIEYNGDTRRESIGAITLGPRSDESDWKHQGGRYTTGELIFFCSN